MRRWLRWTASRLVRWTWARPRLRFLLRFVPEAIPLRCPICSWPMAATQALGCVIGDCSYRPCQRASPDEYRRVQANRRSLEKVNVRTMFSSRFWS